MIDLRSLERKIEQFTNSLKRFHIDPDKKYHSSEYNNLKNVYAIECLNKESSIEKYLIIAKITKIEGSGDIVDAWMKDLSDLYFGWDAESGATVKENMYKEPYGYLWAVSSDNLYQTNEREIIKLMNFLKYELVQLAFQ